MPRTNPTMFWGAHDAIVYARVTSGEMEIDAEGRVWRVARRYASHNYAMRVVPCKRRRAECSAGNGYLCLTAGADGVDYKAYVHRIVWIHFNGPIPDGLTVNHEDGNKRNCAPWNLELATTSEQGLHAYRVIPRKSISGEHAGLAKLTFAQVTEIRKRRANGESGPRLAKDFGVTHTTIYSACNRLTWKNHDLVATPETPLTTPRQ